MVSLNEDKLIETALSNLDISPTDFKLARNRYLSVTEYLEKGKYKSGNKIDIYLQGSFRLGTVVRPYRNKQDADYDIDQVCEINGNKTTARQLKHDVGDWLKENKVYERMLDGERRRCWTLEYASNDSQPGFHIDILPSRLNNGFSTTIDITHKVDENYVWRTSNPKGYYNWFKSINTIGKQLLEEQRKTIYERNKVLYESVSDVPKQLIRTTLQRAIQLLKRHRDVYFESPKYKPISIIITTICAHKYMNQSVLDTVKGFADYVANRLESLLSGQSLPIDNVLDFIDNKWRIKNPADDNENFAEKWASTPELAKSFFAWVYQVRRDIDAFRESKLLKDLNLVSSILQENVSNYGAILTKQMIDDVVTSNKPFLDLIHQAIEGKVSWDLVKKIAQRNIEQAQNQNSKDVAWVNFYQIKIHSREGLVEQEKTHIKGILATYKDQPDFILCCNLLLGSATGKMLTDCIKSRKDDVLSWPIIRLAKNQIKENSSTIIPVL
jgi:hypothetical protein